MYTQTCCLHTSFLYSAGFEDWKKKTWDGKMMRTRWPNPSPSAGRKPSGRSGTSF